MNSKLKQTVQTTLQNGTSNGKNVFSALQGLVPKPAVFPKSTQLSLQSLLSANVHLGHSTATWNQNMLQYLYGSRSNTSIINLDHTITHLRRASLFLHNVSKKGGCVVFVGTKLSLHKLVVELANECNAYYITQWCGGVVTNRERVLKRSVGYDPDKVSFDTSTFESGSGSKSERKRSNQQPNVHTPDAFVLLDYPNTSWAVHEANYSMIPVVALCDSDVDPSRIQYPIPGNDDSRASVELIGRVLARAVKDGHEEYTKSLNK
jgi:small subunit ribosomal protein S2